MLCVRYNSENVGCLFFTGLSSSLCWLFIIFLLIRPASSQGIAATRGGDQDSNIPTHLSFFRSALRGRHKVFWCGKNPGICLDREKNPWGGSTCCFQKFCKDILSDSNNCGGCGNTCGYGLVCCDGNCVDIRNDSQHCGGCFEACPGEISCSYAMCDYGG